MDNEEKRAAARKKARLLRLAASGGIKKYRGMEAIHPHLNRRLEVVALNEGKPAPIVSAEEFWHGKADSK